MDIQDRIDNCENCRDLDKLAKKVRNNRDTAKTLVSCTFSITRSISGTILIRQTTLEAMKAYQNWNKYDTVDEKVQKVTPAFKYGLITVTNDTVQKFVQTCLKRAIEDSADDQLYEIEKAHRRFSRRENNEYHKPNNGGQ